MKVKYVNPVQISCRLSCPTTGTVWVVAGGGVRQYLVIFPQFTCQNTGLNVMDVSILCGPPPLYWSLCVVYSSHNYLSLV